MTKYEIRDKKTNGLYAVEYDIINVYRTIALLNLKKENLHIIKK